MGCLACCGPRKPQRRVAGLGLVNLEEESREPAAINPTNTPRQHKHISMEQPASVNTTNFCSAYKQTNLFYF